MKYTGLILTISFITISIFSFSQSDLISLNSRQYDLLNRLELKLRNDSVLNFSTIKPIDRRVVTEKLQYIQQISNQGIINLSNIDKYNLQQVLNENFDWLSINQKDTILKVKDIFSSKIKTYPAIIGVKQGNFSAYITPLLALEYGKDNNLNHPLLRNSRGLYLHGTLTKGLGYYTYFTSNQERDPLYVQQYGNQLGAVPGVGFYKTYSNDGYDYYDARGGIMFKAAKGIDVQFAYDKVFIGDGYRSLIISDNSSNFLFLKINTRFWKFQYYNLFAQLVANASPLATNIPNPKKYMTFHYLDLAVTKKINFGLFENIMFGRSNGFDLSYLNPIIFYRAAEYQNGSPDKVTLGANIKANVFRGTQLYGQLIINEFVMKEVVHYNNGFWANKQALQLGAKTIDLFGIKNLDAQIEMNFIRPFVYTHYDTVGSFTHYNQPLAHPMGANLREYIAIVKYQPFKRLQLQGQMSYSEQGLDSAGLNMGSNIFELYTTRPRDYGWHIGTGILAKRFYSTITASYEVIPNFFIDANILIRRYNTQAGFTQNTNAFTIGLRWNMARRTFDF